MYIQYPFLILIQKYIFYYQAISQIVNKYIIVFKNMFYNIVKGIRTKKDRIVEICLNVNFRINNNHYFIVA